MSTKGTNSTTYRVTVCYEPYTTLKHCSRLAPFCTTSGVSRPRFKTRDAALGYAAGLEDGLWQAQRYDIPAHKLLDCMSIEIWENVRVLKSTRIIPGEEPKI
jgi:hypothetical protein